MRAESLCFLFTRPCSGTRVLPNHLCFILMCVCVRAIVLFWNGAPQYKCSKYGGSLRPCSPTCSSSAWPSLHPRFALPYRYTSPDMDVSPQHPWGRAAALLDAGAGGQPSFPGLFLPPRSLEFSPKATSPFRCWSAVPLFPSSLLPLFPFLSPSLLPFLSSFPLLPHILSELLLGPGRNS